MKIYEFVGFGCIVALGLIFVLNDNWVVDYISPILILTYSFLYLILTIVNFKKSRFKNDLIFMFISLAISIILLFIVHYYSPKIVFIADKKINKIKQNICMSNKFNIGKWHYENVTVGVLTIKINYIYNGTYSEIRTSPLIYFDRKLIRINCSLN